MTRETFLSRRWNNYLTLILGTPTLVWAWLGLTTGLFSEFTAFIGMVVFAAVY